MTDAPTKAGFVALIGEPNAGQIDVAEPDGGRESVDRHP